MGKTSGGGLRDYLSNVLDDPSFSVPIRAALLEEDGWGFLCGGDPETGRINKANPCTWNEQGGNRAGKLPQHQRLPAIGQKESSSLSGGMVEEMSLRAQVSGM